jgi:hypothetical protein
MVVQEFGAIVVMLLILFIIGSIIYGVINKTMKQPPPAIDLKGMPLLRPVPIPTKNHGAFMRILVWIYDVRKWELAADWEYELDRENRIILPEGFRFDGASIPRVLWAFLNPVGLLLIPGLIHDYGYRHRQLWKIDEEKKEVVPFMMFEGRSKAHWDRLFWKVGNNVNGLKVINFVAFLAVYFLGHGAWWQNRKKEKLEYLSRPVIN